MKYVAVLNNIETLKQERMMVVGNHPVETFAQIRKKFPSADWKIADIIEVKKKGKQ